MGDSPPWTPRPSTDQWVHVMPRTRYIACRPSTSSRIATRSRVCVSLRARENPFTQPSLSFRGVMPTVCGLRAHTYAHVGCTCAYAPSFARSFARSPARPLVHPSDGDIRANLDVARRFCFIRESSSSFVRTRASLSSRSCRLSVACSLIRKTEKDKKKRRKR